MVTRRARKKKKMAINNMGVNQGRKKARPATLLSSIGTGDSVPGLSLYPGVRKQTYLFASN